MCEILEQCENRGKFFTIIVVAAGVSPSSYDRILGTRFGVAAVDLISAGGFGKMVRLQQESIRANATRAIAIRFGD
jgi:6-phosphofructokinase